MFKAVKSILLILLITFFLIAATEIFLFITVRVPIVHNVLPGVITKISRRIFFFYDMPIPQFLPDGGRFDNSLGYTLKPGKFVFSNNESSVQCSINSLGVRDTEAALDSPPIIVLGDSYAMGWGVEQQDIFAKILEVKTGFTVLNAAVPSYGTVREMMLLKKVKRDRLKYLIIQYCENDYDENNDYFNNGNKLITMSKEKYCQSVDKHLVQTRYYLGKYLVSAAKIISNDYKYLFKVGDIEKIKDDRYKRPNDEADRFLHVLLTSGVDLTGVQIILFNATVFEPRQKGFVVSLRKKIASSDYPAFIKNMVVLDATEFLNQDYLFVLDGHFTPRGHQVVAEMILPHLGHH